MGEIPEHIVSEARKAIYDTGRGMIGRERNYLEYRVSRALFAAEKRGREEERERCAKICETHRFYEIGDRPMLAAAIRSGQ